MLVFIAAPILAAIIGFANNYVVSLMGDKLVFDLRQNLYDHLQHLPMRFYDKSSTGGLMERRNEELVNPIIAAINEAESAL